MQMHSLATLQRTGREENNFDKTSALKIAPKREQMPLIPGVSVQLFAWTCVKFVPCELDTESFALPVNSLNDVYGVRLKRFLYWLKDWRRSSRDSLMAPTATLMTIALMLCPPPICGSTVGEVSNQYGVTSVKILPVRS